MSGYLYALPHVQKTQALCLIRPAMLIQALCKNALDLFCRALSINFEKSQIHLPKVKHLLPSRYCDSSLGSFSPWYSKFSKYLHSHYHLYPSYSAWFKMHNSVGALSPQISSSQAIHIPILINTFSNHQAKFFHHSSNIC